MTQSIIDRLPFETDKGLGQKARIGLIVLQSDQTLEHEIADLLRHDGVALYHSRIPNDTEVSAETLSKMARDLPIAAALLPPSFDFDAIAYCCTSGATVISEKGVEATLNAVHPSAKITNPITAAKVAFRALGLSNIGLITPYTAHVTKEMQENLIRSGFSVPTVGSFDQSDDFTVARIRSQDILNAVLKIGERSDCDSVFVSCTSLRVLPILARAEARLGKPVLASNQVVAWHLARLAGLDLCPSQGGRLFET